MVRKSPSDTGSRVGAVLHWTQVAVTCSGCLRYRRAVRCCSAFPKPRSHAVDACSWTSSRSQIRQPFRVSGLLQRRVVRGVTAVAIRHSVLERHRRATAAAEPRTVCTKAVLPHECLHRRFTARADELHGIAGILKCAYPPGTPWTGERSRGEIQQGAWV